MTHMTTEAGVLAAIDGALQDYETSGDAMRWVPPEDREPDPEAVLAASRAVLDGVSLGMEQFMAAMRQLTASVSEALEPWAEFLRKLAPAAGEVSEARRERLSAMHREYHRRSQARRRRRR